jgi:hypothetical protein
MQWLPSPMFTHVIGRGVVHVGNRWETEDERGNTESSNHSNEER